MCVGSWVKDNGNQGLDVLDTGRLGMKVGDDDRLILKRRDDPVEHVVLRGWNSRGETVQEALWIIELSYEGVQSCAPAPKRRPRHAPIHRS